MAETCTHLDHIDMSVEPSSTEGCSECLKIGAERFYPSVRLAVAAFDASRH